LRTIALIEEMRSWSTGQRADGRRIGFVPTMGFLHEGHLSLVRRSKAECDVTVVSVFVNVTQFAPGEDFERYPRDLGTDSRMLQREGVNVLFAPETSDMYRPAHRTFVEVETLGEPLCGAFRPGHFRGVATVVTKLFNIVNPDAAYFGQKDAQQAILLRRMTEDLDFGIQVVVCPTVRESDGLAMSSRNAYLTPSERAAAPQLHAALEAARAAVIGGERSVERVRSLIRARLDDGPARLEYVEIVRASDLGAISSIEGPVLIALAAHLGSTRLIDNVVVGEEEVVER
jgi:pantoate--beta-alanine ligase